MLAAPAVLLLIARLVAPSPAECVVQNGALVMESRAIELVFHGRVVELSFVGDAGYRATFAVDRVWKGSVPNRVDIYVWQLQSEMPRYEKDREYVVLAKGLTDNRVRHAVGLDKSGQPALTAVQCAGALSPEIKKELGPGVLPK